MDIKITTKHDYTKPIEWQKTFEVVIGNNKIELPVSEGRMFIHQLSDSLGIKTQCMYCEKEIQKNSEIILCKECTECK